MTSGPHDQAQDIEAARGSSKVSGFLQEPLARGIIDGIVGPRLKRTFADAEAALAFADAQIAGTQVDLFRALGGGWGPRAS